VGRLLALMVVAGAIAATTGTDAAPRNAGCRPLVAAGASRRVDVALRARADVWGDALLAEPGGPSYARARRYLPPLLLAGQPKQRPLTDSGVYYLAFGHPAGADGGGPVALHVADGGEIVSNHVGGATLTIGVGAGGRERFGSCLTRLAAPTLADGYQPILETSYTDGNRIRFRQESFATNVPETSTLVSFVRLRVGGPSGVPAEEVRFTPSQRDLAVEGDRLVAGGDTVLFFSPGGRYDGTSLVYPISRPRTIEVARLLEPAPSRPIALSDGAYEAARRSVAAYWDRRLADGAAFVVPERRVLDAERNLLIQNLLLTWRYSIGNTYDSFEFPESLENAAVLAEYGFAAAARAIVGQSLVREPHLYPNWEAATRLLAAGQVDRLDPDESFVAAATPALVRSAARLERQLRPGRHDLLRRERYTADLPDVAYGLDEQVLAWQGLRAAARTWAAAGDTGPAAAAGGAAQRLARTLRGAIRRSETTLPDGSLFVPARLLDDERPYGSVAESLHGSYWNLVVPDALASGFFAPGGRQATGALAYLLRHGARLLGLVRAGAYSLYGRASADGSGTDEVYGLDVARFLADNDRPDQLVLSLYGDLAAGMTENTFVAGEGATVAPLDEAYYRSMYLPPNSTSNATFLEMLRLMLVHETTDSSGSPVGLELAYSTPRAWLAPGKQIAVRRAPTAFGPLSYTMDAHAHSVTIRLHVPGRVPIHMLRLRLRRPGSNRITRVVVDGKPFWRPLVSPDTIDLDGLSGTVTVVADVA
jgi:hypothetical protein